MVSDNQSYSSKSHNMFLAILTVACIGAVAESYAQGWEFWVPPLILIGLIASWVIHIMQYRQERFRENFFLIFSMMVSFYHGVHDTSYFDIAVISLLTMATVTLLRRKEFLILLMIEFIVMLMMQTVHAMRMQTMEFDSLVISRLALHVIAEYCAFRALSEVIRSNDADKAELVKRNEERATDKVDMEDFLVNISHELRTPVNAINGLSTIIKKKEDREDVGSIMDAGLRLSRQIDDIQDYSEIQRGDVILEEDGYSITALVNDVVKEFRESCERDDLDVIVDLDPLVPSVLKGDRRRIAKIIRHLLDNAIKFTRRGGAILRVQAIRHDLDINLMIEVTDTGIGMTQAELEKISRGIYQGNKKRNRNTGGIGLGLPIVYGFVRMMNGFVTFESAKGKGTTARVSIAQTVIDPTPCLEVRNSEKLNVAVLVDPSKYHSGVWDFYKTFTADTAAGLRANLYFTPGIKELKAIMERNEITHLFSGVPEYAEDPDLFDRMARKIPVGLISTKDFRPQSGSRVMLMPKPIYAYPITMLLNGEVPDAADSHNNTRPRLDGLRALVVDDEPMNLIVAKGLFGDYNIIVDTAQSGFEAIHKYRENEYDVVFMDHMMPEMDGVEAMKRISEIATGRGKSARVIALTANVVSGAKEMFLREGFAGFIGKPIEISEFERVMNRVFPGGRG